MSERVSAADLETYLRCPRRYEFAHVQGLEAGEERTETGRLEPIRAAICESLRTGRTEPDDLEDKAGDRLEERWEDHDERFHSAEQRVYELRVLEAAVSAYVETVGADHAEGIAALRGRTDGAVVGPELPLSATIEVGDGETIGTEATVDYLTGDGSTLVGVRFVPTTTPLGLLRYRDGWEGDIASLFVDHFDPDSETFEPGPVGALFETAIVLEGLRELRDRLELPHRTCRYVQIPLVERSRARVDWVRESVEATVEPVDLTDVYLDQQTFRKTHEHRNETVDDRLSRTLSGLAAGEFDPGSRWEQIADSACPACEYAVCCEEYLASEVRFGG
ncbi:PD-(D/E)XK nuclease family protein [Natrialbaceae archaeon A-gly3]